jgi:signal transduction histidine kinase
MKNDYGPNRTADINQSGQKPMRRQNGHRAERYGGKTLDSSTSMRAWGAEPWNSVAKLPAEAGSGAYSVDLERAKQVEPDVISVLSHELLSPITLIKGYTATLLRLSDKITEEQKRQYIRSIESAANRLAQLLDNFRDISRFEAGAFHLLIQSTSLPELLRKTVSEIQSQTTKHIIRLRVVRPLPRLNIDRQNIELVVTNLLVNAIKYSPQGGDIEVMARQSHGKEREEGFGIEFPAESTYVIVSVTDPGIGIPGTELERIFEKFYRLDNRLTRATPGAGLGLYICKAIIEAHGGQIWATSCPDMGSTFSFALPAETR